MSSAWGIVVAGGGGRRFGAPKQLAELEGRPLWAWARQALLEGGVEGVVLVGEVPGGIPGGERRRDSVVAGLQRVPESATQVLVHDAARPLATSGLARRVIERLSAGDADAVIPVMPVLDALKRVEGEWVTRSVERTLLMAAQTPQGFRAGLLREAHHRVEGDAPDDAWLVERAGGKVVAIPGERANLKITYREDLDLAAALLASAQAERE